METFFVNHKKIIVAVAGAAAGATFLIWLYQRSKEANKNQLGSEKTEEHISSVPKEGGFLSYKSINNYEVEIPLGSGKDISLPKEVKEQLIKEVDLDYYEGYFKFYAIDTLHKPVTHLSFPKFYLLLKQYRQKRRTVEGFDEERHIKAQAEFVQALRDLLRQTTLEILAVYNIPEEDYEKSAKKHDKYTPEHFEKLMRESWTDVFDLFNGKKLTAEERTEIIKDQTQLYKVEKENIQKLKERHPSLSHADAVQLIQNKIDDQIYKKYSVETEDWITFGFFDTNQTEHDARVENKAAKELFTSRE